MGKAIRRAGALLVGCVLVATGWGQSLPPPDPLSDAVGSIAGQFRVDESGQVSYTIPIATTPGTAGMAPELALQYSSQGGEGPLGRGWSLSGQSQIARCRQAQEHADALGPGNAVGPEVAFRRSDRFCLDGQRLVVVAGGYGDPNAEYRLELDPWTRIFSLGGNNATDPAQYLGPERFVVQRRDGSVSEYGNSPDSRSRINHCGAGTGRACAWLSWAVNRVEDSTGNYLSYHYRKYLNGLPVADSAESDESVLLEVRWTGKRTLPGQSGSDSVPYARLLLDWQALPESSRFSGWQAGSRMRMSQSLAGIRVEEPFGTVLRYYGLQYIDSVPVGDARLLWRVHECADAAMQICHAPTEFTWSPGGRALERVSATQAGSEVNDRLDLRLGDVDGDGRMDVVTVRGPGGNCPHARLQVFFADHASPSGGGNSSTRLDMPAHAEFCMPRGEAQLTDAWHLIDYDGDGRDDLLLAGANGGAWRLHRSLGRPDLGAGMTVVFDSTDLLAGQVDIQVPSNATAIGQWVDANGDGLPDFLYPQPSFPGSSSLDLHLRLLQVSHSGAGAQRGLGDERPVVIAFAADDPCMTGAGAPDGYFLISCEYTFNRTGARLTALDFNGDGRADLALRVQRVYESFPTGATPPPAVMHRFIAPAEFDQDRGGIPNLRISMHW